MGIKHIDSIDEKKGALGILDLMKKGLRPPFAPFLELVLGYLGILDLMKKGLRRRGEMWS